MLFPEAWVHQYCHCPRLRREEQLDAKPVSQGRAQQQDGSGQPVDPQDTPDRSLCGHLCCPSAGSYPSDC